MKLPSIAAHAAFFVGHASYSHGLDVDASLLESAKECNARHPPLTFVFLETEAQDAAVEDDIRRDLATIGLQVEARALSKEDINVARQSGDFHFSLTETWGTPYDPHTTAGGWIDGKGGEGVYPSSKYKDNITIAHWGSRLTCLIYLFLKQVANFAYGKSREELFDLIKDVLQEDNVLEQKRKWEDIHNYYHSQAVMLPLWGKRIPTLMSSRLTGYEAGYQQVRSDPLHLVELSLFWRANLFIFSFFSSTTPSIA